MTGARTEVTVPLDVDCVILGAGVGGALLALLLGRKGHRVLVVESRPDIPSRGADILKPRGIRILAEHGLLDGLVLRKALKRKVIDFHHDGSLLFSYDFAEHTGIGYFLAVPYSKTVGTILAACGELPNVDICFGRRMVDVHVADSGVTEAALDNGTVVRARVFVDSGGSPSPLCDFVAAPRVTSSHGHLLRMTTVPVTPSVVARNRLYFDSSGWFAYFYPVTTELARVFVGVPKDLDAPVFCDRAIDLSARLATFVTHSEDALALLDLDQFVRAPVSVYYSMSNHRGNVALLGSAVFSPHPMTGQGMSYTMEDATVLAEILTEACEDGELEQSLRQRYRPRCSMHSELIAYGDALANSYFDRAAYLNAHRAHLHGGDC
ncbi:FAD-dependent monooxygenase [Nocardia brevicatena]|uniref:FAD-dependent monooxygenase n=1 Tax=Nocardia brevicatena TaxID=37327 RepID=UPI00030934DB|nr:FAD-dependent monooxygenase [Nocardia brevicatena]